MAFEIIGTDHLQPVGEYPHLPTVARAYKSVDAMADELRSHKAVTEELLGALADAKREKREAVDELQREVVALQAQRDDARAEVDNVTDLLKTSGRNVAELSTALAAYQSERDELRDQLEELDDTRELKVRVEELSGEVDRLGEAVMEARSQRDVARAERDIARAEASVPR